MTDKPLPTVITREDAYRSGQQRFFTGKPCKQGHLAQRYVSTGSCVECMTRYALRRHPFRKDLVPYVCPKLWVPTGTTLEQYTALETYLQTCVDTFFAHVRAEQVERVINETAADVRAEIAGRK